MIRRENMGENSFKEAIIKDKEIAVRKSLRYSIMDGTFYSMMVGFGESFFSAFAIFLKANNIQLGLLGSLPQALGSLSQLFSNKLIWLFNSRKRFVCTSALLEGLMYIPIALVFFFGTFRVYHLILFVSIYWVFGMILGPAWSSWMGDLVYEKERGSYFGRRNRIAGLASFFSFLIAGFVLQRFADGTTTQYIGFVVIFTMAFFSRIVSFVYLTKKYEPEYKTVSEAQFSFLEFIKQARFRNYGLFVIYLCLMNFSVFLAGPFFAAYMLYDLKMSYMTFTIVNAAALIVKYISMPVWGKVSDYYGSKKVLSLAGFLMPIVPLLWLFSKETIYIIIIQMYSGFIWAGFEIASFNFIFDTTTPQKRATCVAYYNVLNGAAIILGAMIGGLIVRYNNVFWSKYLFIFLVSFACRYVVSFIFLNKLKEVREVERIPYHKLFMHIITTMPTMGMVHNIIAFTKNSRKTANISIRRSKSKIVDIGIKR